MTTEEKWKARVSEWRSSGKSASKFCAERGFSQSSLYLWASKLSGQAPKMTMARIVVRRDAPAADTPILIEAGGARVSVRRGVDRGLLREVLSALGGSQ